MGDIIEFKVRYKLEKEQIKMCMMYNCKSCQWGTCVKRKCGLGIRK